MKKENDAENVYGEANPIFDGIILGLLDGDNINVSYDRLSEKEDIGIYEDDITAIISDAPNQESTVVNGDFVIRDSDQDYAVLSKRQPDSSNLNRKESITDKLQSPNTGLSISTNLYSYTLLASLGSLYVLNRKKNKQYFRQKSRIIVLAKKTAE